MKIPHFYKARSRLGTHRPPYRQKNINFGVEKAPDFILTSDFISKFQKAAVDTFDFPLPETIKPVGLFSVIANYYAGVKKKIIKTLRPGETQVIVGGDDSVTFPSILASLELVNTEKFGYVRFDSHADMNLYKDSPTKNFHGMYMRPLYGKFDIFEIENMVDNKLKPENSVFIGNLDIDPQEKIFFEKIGINKIDKKKSFDRNEAIGIISKLVEQMHHIHISIDIDAFDKNIAPATGIPADNGLTRKDISPILDILKKANSISFDLVEVNPLKPGASETISLAQEIIERLLKN